MIIVDVVLPFPIRKYFSYIFPYLMNPIIGSRVLVPFHSKDVIGIIIAFDKRRNLNSLNFKFVKRVIDHQPMLNSSLLHILIWLSKYYHYPIGSIFLSILPNFFKSTHIDKNIYQICSEQNIKQVNKFKINKKFFLSKKILFKINKILIKNSFTSWLISEINLFVKIKFYLGLFEKILKKNLQILIIVPYIKDTYKILFFLKQYFNISIDIMDSNLSNQMFFNIWIKTKNGQNSIVIGTKKSVFSPFLKLGLIVLFEEHSSIYKNIDQLKCNIRDIAILRAFKENIPIILDSKTPSLKTLYNIIHKKIFWINFNQNDTGLILKNEIIDLNKEKIRTYLSDTLINKIFENIKKNFSVLLIFNPSDFIFLGLICNYCNWIPRCHICHNYYEVKKYNDIVFCRACLIYYQKPLLCYKCNFFPLTKFNFGIKKIKKNIKKIFPNIPLLFLTNLRNTKIQKLHSNVSNFSILHSGIIITTEQIAQNYYFPNVKLIGLVNIDHYFFSLNFNNTEYFSQFYFNLVNLIQKKSKFLNILIQTSIPNNNNLINICNKKYFFCARNILMTRKKFLLPPWNFQVILYCHSKKFKKSCIFLKFIYIFLKKQSKKDNIVLWFVGPDPVFSTSRRKYIYQLLIQCSSRIYLQKTLRMSLEISKYFSIFNDIKWFLNFDVN
ncbi:MAG: primosomal protein N' [Buchnera aphidicola (Aphis urticata)]|uniref:Probable replication restart protein PriA n=1 Tax=Buchnera aphidicola (Aphis urticata) TaxID=2708353 RepID=A0AAJ4GCE1_9GAMM|nr:MAG: primosomal protein N' [Buchnera aphidicola (Aphis urticata)]